MARDVDIVLFGASGFVGRLTAAHLAAHAPSGTRIALAGRSRERLAAAARDLGPVAADWPLVVADASDEESLRTLAESTRVMVSTVGPYLRHGLPLVQACARAGTHYADLTGEVLFVRASIDTADEAARASGARIVHSCGFDSVPSDLAVLLAHEWAQAQDAGPLTSATLEVLSARGGFSGGTVDSLRLQLDTARRDRQARRLVGDPYALSPDRAREPDLGRQPDVFRPHRREATSEWVAPFVMATYNTRVVRRSNALLDHAYGPRLRYAEVMAFSGRTAALRASAVTGVLAGLTGLLAVQPLRPLLDRLLPSPGTGPGERTRRTGHFRLRVDARTESGRRATVTVAAQGDPGYAATAVMLGQSALALALDGDRLPARAGVLTPATGIGMPLVNRLRHEGFTLDVAT
ncbi:saccharopine dehydrogenase family protein [Kineococcus radiotolerans]|uniref:Saccharopine dehydrogenase n=1 Tax=Kineococcus radiotolerans (strain ATCC BAA-149 / DSM 14245 / SRS30216) TaxID=266940 RepID=A6W9U4_KINRD|nr:saccharopine dehydrogenase NADP-binding domain-containing protein [Kineococcus radiotolerans]ABS03583.1 Saccharopine dehydrogenase [Kineococcus radiotolerans SRS30216 = ATCC BAA-149]